MRPALPFILCALLTTTACARLTESRLNPLNWFGPSAPVANVDSAGNLRPLVTSDMLSGMQDRRVVIDTVDTLTVSRTAEGALVTATGTAVKQGAYNAQLVPVDVLNGTLIFELRVEMPDGFQAQGPAQSRRVTVARALDQENLNGVRLIRVQAARNARTSSR